MTRAAMTATAGVGLAISVAAGIAVESANQRIAQLAFVKKADESLQAIQTQVASANDALFALRDLLDSTDKPISVQEYQFFAKRLRERIHGLRDTGWAPRVARQDRDAFEEATRRAGVSNYVIREPDASGQLGRATDKDVFFPILYPDPVQIGPKVMGVDLIFEPIRRVAVMTSVETRLPASTPPLKLVSGKGSIDGFMSFLPVFGKDGTSAEPRGVVYGVFEIAPLIENVLKVALPATDIGVYFYQPGKPPAAEMIYWHPASGNAGVARPMRADLIAQPHWENVLHMANQTWGVIFVPERSVAASWLSPALIPVGIGLLITAMIEAYLIVSMRRTAQLERLTEELRVTATTLAEKGEKLAHVARHDPLTGLRNRAAFAEDACTLAPAHPDQNRVAVLMVDLDRFKDVNDTLGHAAGDALLREVSHRLNESIRQDDIVARLGGDEFAIVQANDPQPESAERLASRLVDVLCRPYRIFGRDVEIGASVGIAVGAKDAFEIDRMLRRADRALYDAKIGGRGTWRLAPEEVAGTSLAPTKWPVR